MRIYREILKYLKDYVVDRVILTEFDPETIVTEWKNYTPTLNTTDISVFDNAVEFSNIVKDEPLLLQMLYVERLDDRSTLEIDLFLGVDSYEQDEENNDIITLPKDGLEISLCEGYSINSPKIVLKNAEEIPFNELTTVSFTINTSIVNRKDNLANIRTIGFNFKSNLDSLIISKINALNPEFTFTIEDVMEYYTIGLNYVLSGLGLSTLPDNERITEATFKASAGYMWMKQDGNSAKYGNSRNYAVHLLKEADKAILEYVNGGSVASSPYKNIRKLGGYEWSKIQ